MKKLILGTLAASLLVFSCQKKDAKPEANTEETPVITERYCASEEVLQQQMAADPALRKRMADLENFTRNYTAARQQGSPTATLRIPVVVNVLYNSNAENISDAQIQSQIDVLNEDFQMKNGDISLVPDEFSQLKSGMAVEFVWAGPAKRKRTNKKSWGSNDAMKKSSMGGIDPTDPSKNLNIWVCNLGQGLLGYAQFPGGNPATDGVVVLYSAFGSRAKSAGIYTTNYDLGRTATHEVGHWMNLRHIWGDATCGTDLVDDTPVHNTSNGGCPPAGHKSTCTGAPLEMWMNYMDYTYDACMYMFTAKQVTRMDAVFVKERVSFR